MALVKVCGITNLEDALASVQAGAAALGFNFYRRSPRYIEPARAREIVERVPKGVLCVGAAQLHGDETPEFCESLVGARIIKALRVGEDFEPERATEFNVEAILLD